MRITCSSRVLLNVTEAAPVTSASPHPSRCLSREEQRGSSSSSPSIVKGKNGKDRADVWIDLLWRDCSTCELVSPNRLQGFVTLLVPLDCSSLVQPCLAYCEWRFPRHEQPFILRGLPLTRPQECSLQSRRVSVADSSAGNSLNWTPNAEAPIQRTTALGTYMGECSSGQI